MTRSNNVNNLQGKTIPEQKCVEHFPCLYRENYCCTFWKQVEKIPAVWEKVFPGDPECDLQVIDTFREPCLELDEERGECCEVFNIPGDPKWLKCEECQESLCRYIEQPFEVGDTLRWMRKDKTGDR
jgi:hypothetical protein